jgi:flagellar basal-body rod protein FlgF
MFSGLYDAAGAMVVQMNRVNNISNNIANINTVGFKKERINIKTWSRIWGESNAKLPIAPDTKRAENFINETKNSTPHMDVDYVDFSQGPMRHTGNSLDFSIENRGFFLVKTPQGIAYTRDGEFSISKDGILIQKGTGYPVLGENYFSNGDLIDATGQHLMIREDGNVIVDKNNVDKIAIRDFNNYANLKKLHDTLFTPINGERPLNVDNYKLDSGYLEMSNVSVVREMVNLIEAQRAFDRYQKVVDSLGNDIMSDVVKNLSKVT